MPASLSLKIALSLLRARLGQTVVAAAGVTFGIAMFIALVSFMTGLNKLLDGLILNRIPHIRLYQEIKPSPVQPVDLSKKYRRHQNFIRSIKPRDRGREIRNSQLIMRAIQADPQVVDVAPKLVTQVFYTTGTIELGGVMDGIVPAAEENLFRLSDYVITGNLNDLTTVANSIIIGKGIADKMLVEPGDIIQVSTGMGQQALLKVVGIVQFGIAEIDNIQSYTALSTAQKIQGKPPAYITDIQVKLKDITQAPAIGLEYAKLFRLEAMDLQKANTQFETGSNIRSIISYAVGVTLLIVAGFGIYNILNMLIYEKMDAIAILKATGFSGRDVRFIFISLSLIIGIAGGILGLGLGYVLSVIINHIPFQIESLPTIQTYPVNFNPLYYFIGISFALITTYIAGFFPARKASKVDPVVIIRGK
ncbi:FtsX-like permease family protein [Adhaeribacter rhizoryzae]|uniref:ABC transporter permease n=1 Tax=Adhaeribacter rhizoryzae TaxID=2607907 RepID=A0A5M6D436_9BACT|nr:FtsX-like permease family protein [Adhaeribacter rhizoryzae]KAA5539945.1 ABC transporter permease [Adhaeribacter rhizoryzae]